MQFKSNEMSRGDWMSVLMKFRIHESHTQAVWTAYEITESRIFRCEWSEKSRVNFFPNKILKMISIRGQSEIVIDNNQRL